MHSTAPSRSRLAAAVVTLALAAATLAAAGPVDAAPPTTDPATAAAYGARWAAAQVGPQGFVPGPTATPNVSATIETALALADAGVEQATFTSIMTWLQANAGLAIDPDGVGDSAGNLGQLLLLARAAGIDPTAFGGQDLIARLGATLGAFAPGLYGASDPTYDGAFRQSLALLGLSAVGASVPSAAITWLVGQQCDTTVPAAAGGWEPYRADTSVACVAPDTVTFAGPDTNSTAMALQALVATGATAGRPAALDFLAAAEDPTGGFAFIPHGDVDPNSTSLVILAIIAGGEDPAAGRWVRGAATPVTSLLGWQLGCTEASADQGAFASPFSAGAPDALATRQAVWGASLRPFSSAALVTFHPGAAPCVAPTTTTTTTQVTTSTTTPPGAAAATETYTVTGALPVTATPAYTG